mgnify:CR=1 FL=1
MIVRWKDNIVEIGAGRPVVIQSMTNTDTADVESSTKQVLELAQAGSELVRLTVTLRQLQKRSLKFAGGWMKQAALFRW